MKFITIRENLKQGLAIVSHLTSKNINLPILNNILIKAKKEGIELTSTNLEISIEHFLRGKIEKEGEFTVDARLMNDYISLLPEDKIEVNLIRDDLAVSCKNYKTKIRGQVATDFPFLPKNENKEFCVVSSSDLKNALSGVIFSVANNESRMELSGVLFKFKSDSITIVATDSYRLSEKKIKTKEMNLGEKDIIVPAKTVQEILRILNNFKIDEQIDAVDDVKISLNENQIFFSFGSTNISSRLIIGNYPDYQSIIPSKEFLLADVNRANLIRAVKSAGIFSKTGINDINLVFKKNKIIISSSSSHAGENVVEIDCVLNQKNDPEVDIFVNYKYLLEGLNNLNAESVLIKIVDNNTPCVIVPKNEENSLYLVMPIRQ